MRTGTLSVLYSDMSLVPGTVSNTVVEVFAYSSPSACENHFPGEIAGCIFEDRL